MNWFPYGMSVPWGTELANELLQWPLLGTFLKRFIPLFTYLFFFVCFVLFFSYLFKRIIKRAGKTEKEISLVLVHSPVDCNG